MIKPDSEEKSYYEDGDNEPGSVNLALGVFWVIAVTAIWIAAMWWRK